MKVVDEKLAGRDAGFEAAVQWIREAQSKGPKS